LRVEDAGTFEAIHLLVKKLIADGRLQGLRLDHIDGLRDPAQYFQRLRRLIRDAQGEAGGPFYVVVEKILGEHEKLHAFAGVHGTTGYEWLNAVTQVLVDGGGLDPLDEVWRQISNTSPKLDPVLKDAKRRVLATLLTSEFTVLTRLLARIAGGHYSTRDYSADSLRQALELYVLHFPVYRSYLTSAGATPHESGADRRHHRKGARRLVRRDEGIFDFLRDALTMDLIRPGGPAHSAPRVRPLRPESAAVHRPRHGEVAGGYRVLSLPPPARAQRGRRRPIGQGTFGRRLSRGDESSRRGVAARHDRDRDARHQTREDARARLLALAEIPGEWTSAVARWKVLNAPHLVIDGEMRAPSATFEYMLYQTLLGAWPAAEHDDTFAERMQAYALKAAREGKQETSWLNPNQAYEAGLRTFIERILDRAVAAGFVNALGTLARRTALLGALNFAEPDHPEGRPCPGCRISIRVRSSGICPWSIPTTGGRWISPNAPRCCRR